MAIITSSYGVPLPNRDIGPVIGGGVGFNDSTLAPISAAWVANTAYKVGQLVHFGAALYRVTADHTSPATFSTANMSVFASAGGVGDVAAANNLSEFTATAPAARLNLGLGTAATQPSSAFDPAGAAAAVQILSQPVDADLSAIAALGTTLYGRGFLTELDAASARAKLALGDIATTSAAAYSPSGHTHVGLGTGTGGTSGSFLETQFPVTLGVALSDETSVITSGTRAKIRSPYGFTLTEVRLGASVADNAAVVRVDVLRFNSIFTVKPQIEANGKTSVASNTQQVLAWTAIAEDEELTINAEISGTTSSLRGLKVWFLGYRTVANSSVTTPVVPGQVFIASATAGTNQVSLAWSAPAAGSTAIDNYQVEYKLTSGTTWTVANITALLALSYTVTGLTAASYDFRVSAHNASGFGTVSPTITRTATAPSAPDAPVLGLLTATSGTAAVLTWTTPASNGSAIIDYTVQWGTSASGFYTLGTATVTASPYTITGLSVGTSYIVRATARNSLGSSAQSQSVGGTTWSLPTAPQTSGSAPTGASGSVTLTWAAPASTGGGTLDNYRVDYRVNGSGAAFTSVTVTAPTTTATITGLTNGAVYEIIVYSHTIVGYSATGLTLSGTPTAAGGSYTINPSATNTKYLESATGTAANTKSGTGATVQPTGFSQSHSVGWAQENNSASSYIAQQLFIDFPLTLVSGTTCTAASLTTTIADNSIFNQSGPDGTGVVGNEFTVELYAYPYGTTVEAADWASTAAISAFGPMLASISFTSSTPAPGLAGVTVTPNGTNLRTAVTAAIGGNLRMIGITNLFKQNLPPPATGGNNVERANFNKVDWALSITTGV